MASTRSVTLEGQNVAIGYRRAGLYRSVSDARSRYGCFQRSCGRASSAVEWGWNEPNSGEIASSCRPLFFRCIFSGRFSSGVGQASRRAAGVALADFPIDFGRGRRHQKSHALVGTIIALTGFGPEHVAG